MGGITKLKIVLHLEIDESECDFEGIEDVSKSKIKLELTIALNTMMNEIEEWVNVCTFIEDDRDNKREE